MDLNTVLMESINNMSELFVAANTRTSFTELAESSSNSLGHLGTTNSNNMNTNSSVGHPNTGANNQPMPGNHLTNVHKQSSPTSLDHLRNTSPTPMGVQKNCYDIVNGFDSPQLQNSNPNFKTPMNHDENRSNPYRNDKHPTTGLRATRIVQTSRTQIPIHCFIEQLDACTDMFSYQSTLTDNDLFKTANPSDQVRASTSNQDLNILNSSNNCNNLAHLHQSKLALESVTNPNRSSSSLPQLNESDLFDDNEPTDALDCNDTNLNHLTSGSSLSLHPPIKLESQSSSTNGFQPSTNLCNEVSNGQPPASCCNNDNQNFQSLKETYVIVSSSALYIDLTRIVMQQLGYSPLDQINAKITLQVKNWKPLTLDSVCEDKTATVGEVLGDISSFVTLRIKLYSNSVNQAPVEWTETIVRHVVLNLTQTMSQLMLSKLCNISQPLISAIVRGGKKLGHKKCQEFRQWYLNYIQSTDVRPPVTHHEGSSARLVFDKTREIPRLKSWFANNTKPTEELLEEYSRIMNEDTLRKDRPQVSARALKNWWKNERQKLGIRQREIRGRPKIKQID